MRYDLAPLDLTPGPDDPPDQLFTFDPADWGDGPVGERFAPDFEGRLAAWVSAARRWDEIHGWPGGGLWLARTVRSARLGRDLVAMYPGERAPRTHAEALLWSREES